MKILVAGEPQPRLFRMFADNQATITALPLAKLLTVAIIAYNEAGDRAESATAAITLT